MTEPAPKPTYTWWATLGGTAPSSLLIRTDELIE